MAPLDYLISVTMTNWCGAPTFSPGAFHFKVTVTRTLSVNTGPPGALAGRGGIATMVTTG